MSKDNLRALRKEDISPAIVLQSLEKELPNLEDIYVVGVDKSGEPTCWATGNLKGLTFAALVMQDLALKFLNKQIEE